MASLTMTLAAVGAGCSVDPPPEPTQLPPENGKSGPDASVSFVGDDGLALAPGEARTLRIVTDPPDAYQVSFALLGEALDATLGDASVVASSAGEAEVELRAPSNATLFRLRAKIEDGGSAEIEVSVSDEGFGTIRLVPSYAGKRAVDTWAGAVVAHTTCTELGSLPPGELEGALEAAAPAGSTPLIIENAPVGPTLAVVVRAGHYVWGCKDETHLVAGKALDVEVDAANVPMNLAATELAVSLSFEPEDLQAYRDLVSDAAGVLAEAAFPLQATEVATLLDTIASLAGNDASAYESARSAGSFDEIAAAHWTAKSLSVRGTVGAWALAGLPSSGALTGALLGDGASTDKATLTLDTFGGLDAEAVGSADENEVTWTADPDDTVHLGGAVTFSPARFAGAAALLGAQAELPAATSVSEAMAALVDCQALATQLGPFGSCDVACHAALCADALDHRWQTGLGATDVKAQLGKLSFNASGAAQVDDMAAPVLFSGSWLGEAKAMGAAVKLAGEATATTPVPQEPPSPR
ncbi:MAG: hypothetical protein WKG00_38430 [Polyangiaceae bacterium]